MEIQGSTDRHALLEGMNLQMLGLGIGTAFVALVLAAVGTAVILRRYRGTPYEGDLRKWARIGWIGFIVYLAAYIGFFVHRSSPEKVPYPFASGDKLIAKGDYNGAIRSYEAVVQKYPHMALAHFKLGMALRMVKAIGPSIRELKESIKEDPDQAEPYFALGSIIWTQGTSEDAMPYFRKGLELDPTNRQRAFFLKIINRGEMEKKGLIKPGTTGRPQLSPPAPVTPGKDAQ